MKTKLVYVIGSIVIACPVYSKIPSFVGDLVARDLVGAGCVFH